MPFTVYLPPRTSADTLHPVAVQLAPAGGAPKLAAVARVSVQKRLRVSALAAPEAIEAPAGGSVRHRFLVRNEGNQRGEYSWSATSTPGWRIYPRTGSLRLEAGESRPVEVSVQLPPGAAEGTLHLLRLEVAAEEIGASSDSARASAGESPGAGEDGALSARAEARTRIAPTPARVGLYPRLPLEASAGIGSVEGGRAGSDLHLRSEGEIAERTRLAVDLDVATGGQASSSPGWRDRRLWLSLARPRAAAEIGDVASRFSPLILRPLMARGARVRAAADSLSLQIFLGRDWSLRRADTYGLGLRILPSPGLGAGLELVLRDGATTPDGEDRTTLLCLSVESRGEAAGFLSLQAAGSEGRFPGGSERGGALELRFDRPGRTWQSQVQATAGSSRFSGPGGGRDAWTSRLLYTVAPAVRLWLSLDASRGGLPGAASVDSANAASGEAVPASAVPRWVRTRLGGRWGKPQWPTVELSLSRDDERGGAAEGGEDLRRDELGLSVTHSLLQALLAVSTHWGRVRGDEAGPWGGTRRVELGMGGSLFGLRTALRWTLDRDYLPLSARAATTASWSADLAWTSVSDRAQAGLGVLSRAVEEEANAGALRDLRVCPRAGLRLAGPYRLSLEATLARAGASTRVDRWQVGVSYSGRDVLPVPWSPVRGTIRGVVFLDENADGVRDPDEPGVPDVMVLIGDRVELTDAEGGFERAAVDPGEYHCDLNRASLPRGCVPGGVLPLTIEVMAGGVSRLQIPLLGSGSVSGRVFLDADHDERLSVGEEGLPEIRVLLLQGGEVKGQAMTDAAGRFRLSDVAPGKYRLRVASPWLPADWEATTGLELPLLVRSGESIEAPPYGLAPRRKPVLRTYQGGSR